MGHLPVSSAGILAAAMVLDAIFGEPKWLWTRWPHPAILMGRMVSALEQRLNRDSARKLKGVLGIGLLALAAVLLGALLSVLGPVADLLVVAVLLAQKSLVDHVRAVAEALRVSLEDGRRAVAMIVGRDTSTMTEAEVARAAIESASENLSDGVIAPAFWFMIAGLPGLLLYKIVNTADSMIGHRTSRYAEFGWAAARLDDLLNLIPARLTGALLALRYHKLADWQAIAAEARQHRSPNAGWPEAAMARALDVALSGPRSYAGQRQKFAFVHANGRREIGPAEIEAACSALWQTWAMALGGVAICAVVLG